MLDVSSPSATPTVTRSSSGSRPSRHVARTTAARQIRAGALLLIIGVAATVLYQWIGPVLMIFGALLILVGRNLRQTAAAVEILNPCHDAITRGDFATAEKVLDEGDAQFRSPYIRRTMLLQRAVIAWRRADPERVQALTTEGLSLPLGRLTKAHDRIRQQELTAMRALARVASGRLREASEDIAEVRASSSQTVSAIARVELAEALRLERTGDLLALREHLAEHQHLIMEATQPHERAMVLALDRLAHTRLRSAYRERPSEVEPDAELTIDAWIAAIAPNAEGPSHVNSSPMEVSIAESPSPPGSPVAGVPQFKVRSASSVRLKLVAIWLILVVMFFAIWSLLRGGPDQPGEPDPLPQMVSWLTGMLVLVVGAAVYVIRRRALKHQQDIKILTGAQLATARSDFASAKQTLSNLAKSRAKLTAGQAELGLAVVADHEARFEDVRSHCTRAAELLTYNEHLYLLSVDLILPKLGELGATAQAALGRLDASRSEIESVAAQFPSYAYLSTARLAVELVGAAVAEDFERAAVLRRECSSSMPLALRHAFLGDVALALSAPVGVEERRRLQRSIERQAPEAMWAQKVAPALIEAFQKRLRSETDPSQAGDAAEAPAEAAEAETAAIAEAELAEAESAGEAKRGRAKAVPVPER